VAKIVPTAAEIALITSLRACIAGAAPDEVTTTDDLSDAPTDDELDDTPAKGKKGKKVEEEPADDGDSLLDDEAEAPEGPTLDDLRSALKKLGRIGDNGKAMQKKILAKFHCKTLDEFPEDKIGDGIKITEKQIAKLSA
jgi:hypothetical protein